MTYVEGAGIFLENWNWGCNKILGGALPSRPFPSRPLSSPTFPPLPLPSHIPSPSLRSRPPLIQLGGLGEHCSKLPQPKRLAPIASQPTRGLGERRKLPSGVWGGAPAENDFGAF